MYLIAACLPLLRPIFAKHTPALLKNKIFFSSSSRGRPRDYNVELTSQNIARLGFTQLDTPRGTMNDNISKSDLSEGSSKCISKDNNPSESELSVLPKRGIEVTREVIVQHSDLGEEAKE